MGINHITLLEVIVKFWEYTGNKKEAIPSWMVVMQPLISALRR